MRPIFSAALAIALLSGGSAFAADATKTQVMLVGTYHFSNPGRDVNNVKAVDVLAAERQREIARLVASLAKFAPTKVAVEWPAQVVQERYPKFLAGQLPESSNEVVQLGFRLARERGLKSVYGLDVDGDFPLDAVMAWAEKHGRKGEIDALIAAGAKETGHISALQDKTSIGGVLRDLNTRESIERNYSFYPPMLTMGAGDDQPGVKLLTAWYERNFAICARLLQQVQRGDRVVVFYGQGHIYLLQQCLREQPGVQLVDPLSYLSGT
ncbi:MAG TPA: DUF5694 domain-containing protein [Steroidobacteraceae bacterium]|nr:DUF5694 domain-containing protein [Steroidobacteraceae bacterium]